MRQAAPRTRDAFRPEDLAVIIPTRHRWPMLQRALDRLATQSHTGFEVVVVADGRDQHPDLGPHAGRVILLEQDHAGPGTARNLAAARTGRPLLLLMGDDMMAPPDLIARHLDAHNRRPDPEHAVLGRVEWHPESASGRIQRWLDWSGTQFDYSSLAAAASPDGSADADAGWARFYSSNVSLKRELFDRVGGFDPDFKFLYEDIELGWRLAQAGMQLWFEPAARTEHLHHYDWPSLRRRFETAASAERLMVAKHPWFEPWFLPRAREALATAPPSRLWALVVDHLPEGPRQDRARGEANRWYHRQLAPFFLNAWESDRDLEELKAYLGESFDIRRLHGHSRAVEDEQEAAADEETFYRTSESYLYDLTAFASWDTKIPYRSDVCRYSPPGSRLLDYGCGIGSDGLRLAELGYAVDFADYDNPSTRYLRWRLARRGIRATVYDIEAGDIEAGDIEAGDIAGGDIGSGGPGTPRRYHLAFSFDVIEHVADPFAFLERLEAVADLVAVNFLEPDPGDTHLHHELPIPRLLDRARDAGLIRYRRYHRRSHFVIYRSPQAPPDGGLDGRLRSAVRRHLGPLLSEAGPLRAPGSPGGRCWSG